jgi:hypothetical protein
MPLLHFYRCRRCQTVATAPFKAEFGPPVRCILCRSYMTWLYADQITTPEEDALARRGVVYNPFTAVPDKTCDNTGCRNFVGPITGIELAGIGSFCSAHCADAAALRHEAAQSQPSADLMGVPNGSES